MKHTDWVAFGAAKWAFIVIKWPHETTESIRLMSVFRENLVHSIQISLSIPMFIVKTPCNLYELRRRVHFYAVHRSYIGPTSCTMTDYLFDCEQLSDAISDGIRMHLTMQ